MNVPVLLQQSKGLTSSTATSARENQKERARTSSESREFVTWRKCDLLGGSFLFFGSCHTLPYSHSHNSTTTIMTIAPSSDPVQRVEEIRVSILSQLEVVNGFYKFPGSPFLPAEVVKGFLYLGGTVHASNEEFIQGAGIMHVLNCANLEARGVVNDVRYHELCAQDTLRYDLLKNHMQEAHAFLRESGDEPILVHCYAGMNRSAALVVSYLMVYGPSPPAPSKEEEEAKSVTSGEQLCMSFDEAVRFVLEKRPYALSNPNFVKQLADFEKEWQKEATPSLKDESYASE